MSNSDCLFCKIVAGDIPSKKIFENESTIAFLDIFPANPGHSLVIPKVHAADIHDATAEQYGQVAAAAKEVADLLQARLNPSGTSIFQMNKPDGWQTVFHLHMHVIPRWSGDALHKPWDIAPAVENELVELQRKILGE